MMAPLPGNGLESRVLHTGVVPGNEKCTAKTASYRHTQARKNDVLELDEAEGLKYKEDSHSCVNKG
jgi:hypothetical protein